MLLPPSPDGRQLLRQWRPPTPFQVWVHFFDRPPELLWVMPYHAGADGRFTRYLASGPAGWPTNRIAHVDVSQVPDGVQVELVLRRNEAGSPVFGVMNHGLN